MKKQVKRYKNRKLYDTDEGRYTTLSSLAEMIRNGSEVEVTLHSTGEDVTNEVLSQVVVAHSKALAREQLVGLIKTIPSESLTENSDITKS